jgi:hypothetical protein
MDGRMKRLSEATWADLTEPQPPDTFTSIEFKQFTEEQKNYIKDGVLHLPGFFTDDDFRDYIELREGLPKDRKLKNNYWGGWSYPTPYLEHGELRELALNPRLMEKLEHVIGEEMGLHLCLTGWVSTERNFHQDTYLNHPDLWSKYLAVWIALDDISPDVGPFQYVPGSNHWPCLKRNKLFEFLTAEERSSPHWPTFTQGEVSRVCQEEMARRNQTYVVYTPKKGDVLIWHANLIHRGSQPLNPELLRKSLICHYSAVATRSSLDMPRYARDPATNGIYFKF